MLNFRTSEHLRKYCNNKNVPIIAIAIAIVIARYYNYMYLIYSVSSVWSLLHCVPIPDPLKAYFCGNTPRVTGDQMCLQVCTNKPAEVVCRIDADTTVECGE